MDTYFVGYCYGNEEEQFRDEMFVDAVDIIDAFMTATMELKEKFEVFYIDCLCKEETDEYLFN